MFITRMSLDINRPDTMRALSSRTELDAAVRNAFDGVQVHALWRLDQLNNRTHIVISSPIRPTLQPMHEQYGYPGCFPSWWMEYSETLDNLAGGSVWDFELTACIPHPEAERSDPADMLRAIAACHTADQIQWLQETGEPSGFSIIGVTPLRSQGVIIQEDASIVLHMVDFAGRLQVTDADRFRMRVTDGIGSFCRCGAGLMTLNAPSQIHHLR